MTTESIVGAWLTLQKNWWAHEALSDLIREDPIQALRTIENIAHRAEGDLQLLGMLAAGPLEDLLVAHGPTVIEALERIAKNDQSIRKCLTGVWKNDISDEVFARVQRASEPNFKFPPP